MYFFPSSWIPSFDCRKITGKKICWSGFLVYNFLLFTANKTNLFIRFWENLQHAQASFDFIWSLETKIWTRRPLVLLLQTKKNSGLVHNPKCSRSCCIHTFVGVSWILEFFLYKIQFFVKLWFQIRFMSKARQKQNKIVSL